MKILVVHFSNWLGYHLVEGLLNDGYEVTVITKGKGYSFFLDFFQRNSDFTVAQGEIKEHFYAVIWLGEEKKAEIKGEKHLFIPLYEEMEETSEFFYFGEWMPMNKAGVFYRGEHVPFSSDFFQKEGIDMVHVVKLLLWWISKESFQGIYKLEMLKDIENQVKTLENSLFLQENKPIGKSIQRLLSHYQKYAALYPQVK